jgi:Domain of unknown function (DUF4382)
MVRKMSGRLRTSIVLLSALVALIQLQGCGGGKAASPTSLQVAITKSSSVSATTTTAAAGMIAAAASQPVPSPTTYSSIVLSIKAIQLVPVGSDPQTPAESAGLPVIPLANSPVSVDISTLNYLQQVLGQAVIPPGKYNQVRLVLSDNQSGQSPANYVTLNGSNTKIPLDTPSGQQSGVKILGRFEVKTGEVNAIVLSFDPATAIVTTGSGKYVLKPTGIRIDQVASLLSTFGSIYGTIHTPVFNPHSSATFKSWSSATVSVVPRDPAAPAIAAGTVFSNFSSPSVWKSSLFTINVPPNSTPPLMPSHSYKVFVQAYKDTKSLLPVFQLYSSPSIVVPAAGTTIPVTSDGLVWLKP